MTSLEQVMEVANGFGFWVCAFIVLAIVLIQTISYIKLSYKNAEKVGLSKAQANQALKTGLISSIGPAISVFVVVFSLTAVIGAPMTLMRLNMTGGSAVILSSGEVGVKASGGLIGSADFSLDNLAAMWWSISVNGIGWLIVLFGLNHKMEAVRQKIGGGDDRWLKLLTASVTLGLFGYMLAPNILSGGGDFVSAVAGALSMIVAMVLAKKTNKKWIKEYALGIALVVGMVAGTILA